MSDRFPPIPELMFTGVTDPGIPNQERLNIQVLEDVNLAPYGVVASLALADGTAMPLADQFFWFGAIDVPANSWLVLYTGLGKPRVERDARTGRPIFVFYWGKTVVQFASTNIVPIVFQIGSLVIGENAGAPQKQVPPPPKEPTAFWKALRDYSVASESSKSLEDILGMTKKPALPAGADIGSIFKNDAPKDHK